MQQVVKGILTGVLFLILQTICREDLTPDFFNGQIFIINTEIKGFRTHFQNTHPSLANVIIVNGDNNMQAGH